MKKIHLSGQSYGQRGGSGLAVAFQAHVAERGIELIEVAGMKIDGQSSWAVERVSAQMAVGLQLAGRSVQLQLAQIDGAVALGISCIHRAGCWNFSRQNLRGRREIESRADGNVARKTVGPIGGGQAVDAGIQSQALKGRLAHHPQKRIH